MTTITLDTIYDEVPSLQCIGKCQESCGPVMMSTAEEKVLQDNGFSVPNPVEILRTDLRCPLLGPLGNCTAYKVRPLICRLWGVVESMQCPFGCKPQRWLSDAKAQELIMRAEAL